MIRLFMTACICVLCMQCASDPTVGYTSSSLYPTHFRSVAVPIFDNSTMTRNIEFMLTDALIKEIQSRTHYRILGEQYADTLLTGTIKNVDLQMLSQSRNTGLVNEMLVKVVLDFEWLNLMQGGRITGRKNFASSAVFIPSRPSSEPFEIGEFAVVQQLASDIVDQMQASW